MFKLEGAQVSHTSVKPERIICIPKNINNLFTYRFLTYTVQNMSTQNHTKFESLNVSLAFNVI